MDQLIIDGGQPLNGTVQISGAKNAALPLMAACLLTAEPVRLFNLPRLADVTFMGDILNHHGTTITLEGAMGNGSGFGRIQSMHTPQITDVQAPYDMVRKMRASVLVLGPLLARAGRARVSLPGGCAIGARPIDLHLKALEAMGATIVLEGGYVEASAPGGLSGGEFVFPFVSVGATENALMAATLARGRTVLVNAAREPEIVDLGNLLNAMGARITGLGTERIEIEGVVGLHGTDYSVLPDRIEAGSYAVAAAITGGRVVLKDARADLMKSVLAALKSAGCSVEEADDSITIARSGPLRPVDIRTQPFPGFPTDMQAQFMALMCLCEGTAVFEETIFENRFMHAPELQRLGAQITVSGNHATVRGVRRLVGAPVMATDLRASMGLALAGLAAEGRTTLSRLYHLDRGYERLEEKLLGLGARVERVSA